MSETLGWDSLGTSFDCACGKTHALPIHACYTGTDASAQMAGFARQHCGPSCLLVSDENTRQAAGEQPLSDLSTAGKHVTELMYPGAPLEATLELAQEIAARGEGADLQGGDHDVDSADTAQFVQCISAPGAPSDPQCGQ